MQCLYFYYDKRIILDKNKNLSSESIYYLKARWNKVNLYSFEFFLSKKYQMEFFTKPKNDRIMVEIN
jgi:hypothetical protein